MPINASYEYFDAEKVYLNAQTLEEKIAALEHVIKVAPKHKSAENLLAELRTRLKKLKEKQEKGKKVGKGKSGIKKEGYQVVLVGLTNCGKSSLLAKLTNATPKISDMVFTTKDPEIGTMDYEGVKAQIVDLSAVGIKDFDYGVANSADCLLLVINELNDLAEIEKALTKSHGRRIIVLNKIDRLGINERRKLEAYLKSKKLDFILVSAENGEGVPDLKRRIFLEMHVIRVYTKEPGKAATKEPIVLREGSTVRDAAENIYKGFSSKIKETRLTGPSGKFANQVVGLNHGLKDRDVVEFKTN